VIMYYNVICK